MLDQSRNSYLALGIPKVHIYRKRCDFRKPIRKKNITNIGKHFFLSKFTLLNHLSHMYIPPGWCNCTLDPNPEPHCVLLFVFLELSNKLRSRVILSPDGTFVFIDSPKNFALCNFDLMASLEMKYRTRFYP